MSLEGLAALAAAAGWEAHYSSIPAHWYRSATLPLPETKRWEATAAIGPLLMLLILPGRVEAASGLMAVRA